MNTGSSPGAEAILITRCALCSSEDRAPFFSENGFPVVRCTRCGLLYCAERPLPATVRRMYEEEKWVAADGAVVRDDSEYDSADEARTLEAREHLAYALQHVRPPGRLLDVGCGSGHLVYAAREAGFDAEGVELSEARVRSARARGLTVHRGGVSDLSLPDSSVDVVMAVNVLSHVPDPMEFLAELARITRPGGACFLVTGNKADLARFEDGRRLGDFWGVPGHLYFFGESQLRRAVSAAGFAVESVECVSRLDSRLSAERLRWPGRWYLARRALGLIPPLRSVVKLAYRRLMFRSRPESGNLRVVARRPQLAAR